MTSFETAQKLKVAGFPQPEPSEGQFWYNAFEDRFVVISMSYRRAFVGYCGHTKTAAILLDQFAFSVFAPTATDILLQLPDGHSLTRANQDMFICTEGKPLMVTNGVETNPAEAAAIDWFEWKGIETRDEWFFKKYDQLKAKK